jgi:hypothetical protein
MKRSIILWNVIAIGATYHLTGVVVWDQDHESDPTQKIIYTRTSPIVSVNGREVMTESGRSYSLLEPPCSTFREAHPGFDTENPLEWLKPKLLEN